MAFYYKVLYYLIPTGPFAVAFQKQILERCDGSWWTEFTYTMNFMDSDKVCMGWTWYLGDDMIFFIIAQALLMPIYCSNKQFFSSSSSSS